MSRSRRLGLSRRLLMKQALPRPLKVLQKAPASALEAKPPIEARKGVLSVRVQDSGVGITDQIRENLVNHDLIDARWKRPKFGLEMQLNPCFDSLRHMTHRDVLDDLSKVDGLLFLVERSADIGPREFDQLNQQALQPVDGLLYVLE